MYMLCFSVVGERGLIPQCCASYCRSPSRMTSVTAFVVIKFSYSPDLNHRRFSERHHSQC